MRLWILSLLKKEQNNVEAITINKDTYFRQLQEYEERGYQKGHECGYKHGLETIRLKFTGNPNDTLEKVYQEYKSLGF